MHYLFLFMKLCNHNLLDMHTYSCLTCISSSLNKLLGSCWTKWTEDTLQIFPTMSLLWSPIALQIVTELPPASIYSTPIHMESILLLSAVPVRFQYGSHLLALCFLYGLCWCWGLFASLCRALSLLVPGGAAGLNDIVKSLLVSSMNCSLASIARIWLSALKNMHHEFYFLYRLPSTEMAPVIMNLLQDLFPLVNTIVYTNNYFCTQTFGTC